MISQRKRVRLKSPQRIPRHDRVAPMHSAFKSSTITQTGIAEDMSHHRPTTCVGSVSLTLKNIRRLITNKTQMTATTICQHECALRHDRVAPKRNASTSLKNRVAATANSQRERARLESPQRIPRHDRVAGFRVKIFHGSQNWHCRKGRKRLQREEDHGPGEPDMKRSQDANLVFTETFQEIPQNLAAHRRPNTCQC